MRRVWSLGIVAFLIAAPPLRAGVDFLIVEHTDRLRVLNKYQQEASAQDRHTVMPFAPMRILKSNEMLGDGYTSCMQVEVDGQTFYLLTNKDGSLSTSGPLGFERTYLNCTILLDTISLLADRSIMWSPAGSTGRSTLARQNVLRLFRHRNETYSRLLSAPFHFGWLDLKGSREGKDWAAFRSATASTPLLTSSVVPRIRARVDEVNRVLTRLYMFFNEQADQPMHPPQWSFETSDKIILCALQGAGSEAFTQSTFYLVNDIENIVLGSGFQVGHSSGRIEIRQK